MAAAIADLLADRVRLAEMGRAARARVEAEFTLERMVAGVEAVYRRTLTSTGA
jgi:glycosyltransferase involved in cell wall biosynthesis